MMIPIGTKNQLPACGVPRATTMLVLSDRLDVAVELEVKTLICLYRPYLAPLVGWPGQRTIHDGGRTGTQSSTINNPAYY